jgi:hypothetical protein
MEYASLDVIPNVSPRSRHHNIALCDRPDSQHLEHPTSAAPV